MKIGDDFGMDNVAIVIPVLNREVSLLAALDSVRQQTHSGAECVVVDDGSTESLVACREYVEREIPRGKWITLPENRGVAAARNAGVAATEARWISFLDSDDLWLPSKLEAQLAWHDANPDSRISQVEEAWFRNGAPVKKPTEWNPHEGDIFSHAIERCAISPSAVMIRRDLWEEQGGFDETFRVCEDYELWLRITAEENVGLVEREQPLVKKHAGHGDQLSNFPAMDRHRVAILLRFLARLDSDFPAGKRGLICDAIRRKAGIVASGAKKRELVEREELFSEIATMSDEAGAEWLAARFTAILAEIESSESPRPA